ncbi:MAG: hypothetical protein ACFFAN_18680, partial [Promethearchaeota archaeon]
MNCINLNVKLKRLIQVRIQNEKKIIIFRYDFRAKNNFLVLGIYFIYLLPLFLTNQTPIITATPAAVMPPI